MGSSCSQSATVVNTMESLPHRPAPQVPVSPPTHIRLNSMELPLQHTLAPKLFLRTEREYPQTHSSTGSLLLPSARSKRVTNVDHKYALDVPDTDYDHDYDAEFRSLVHTPSSRQGTKKETPNNTPRILFIRTDSEPDLPVVLPPGIMDFG